MGKQEKDSGAGSQPVLKKKDRSRYWKQWHSENKDALNERRRQRYASDAKYRARVRAASRRQDRTRPRVEVPRVKTQVLPVRVTLMIERKRREVLLYHRQDAANAIGITVERLKLWLRQGFVPKASYTHPTSGFGLYTREQLNLLARTAHEVFKGEPPTRPRTRLFKRLVHERWSRLPAGVGDWKAA